MTEKQTLPTLSNRPKPIIIVGNYGSGKTEVAINLARQLRVASDGPLHLIDLDIVNPYFRSREAVEVLRHEGITVIAPEGENAYAEIPMILPAVRSLITAAKRTVILDVGGDDAGATVLASLRDAIHDGQYELWMVLNKKRPFTVSIETSIEMIRQIERASTLKTTGLIANTHLLQETTIQIIEEGLEMVKGVSRSLSLPIAWVAVRSDLVENVKNMGTGLPILPMKLTMRRPWERNA